MVQDVREVVVQDVREVVVRGLSYPYPYPSSDLHTPCYLCFRHHL